MWTILQPALARKGGTGLQPVQQQPTFALPPRRHEPDRSPELREALESLLFRTRPDSVEKKAEDLRASFDGVTNIELEDMIAANCETSGAKFASAFSGKYIALGDVMGFLSDHSQDRLLNCLAGYESSKFQSLSVRDITYAINNPGSRNSYTKALARYVLNHPELRKTVATRRLETQSELDRRLKSMLTKKVRRA
jgi:hypothetical protein